MFYQPVGGVIAPQRLKELADAIADMESVEIRLTPEEGMYLINCNSKEAQKLLALTEDGANTEFETSVACAGRSICQVGVGDSQKLLRECVEAVRREQFEDGVLPKINISGCPSSCGAQQTGIMGFRGAVKQTENGPVPAFAIFLDGCGKQGNEILAEAGAVIAADRIPDFLVELGRRIAKEHKTYGSWVKTHRDQLLELVEKYSA